MLQGRMIMGLRVHLSICLLLLAACGEADSGPRTDVVLVVKPLGFVAQQARPNSELTLRVLALWTAGGKIDSADDVFPAENQPIAWTLLGLPPLDTALAVSSSKTDAHGIAEVSLRLGAAQSVTLQVQADHEQTEPVAFSVQVLSEQRELVLLGAAHVEASVGSSEPLRVMLNRRAGSGTQTVPVPNARVRAELKGGVRSNGARLEIAPGDVVETLTDGAGIAVFRFETGTTPAENYEIELCGQNSCPGAAAKSVTVDVTARGGGGSSCESYLDCDNGLVCVRGLCEQAAFHCYKPDDCPPGYTCNLSSYLCEPDTVNPPCSTTTDCDGDRICGSAGTCIDDDGCTQSSDCPDGSVCVTDSGACVTEDPTDPGDPIDPSNPGFDALDVRGLWFSTYHFDISDTLGVLQELTPVVDFLRLLFWSQIEIDVPILGDILEALIDSLIAEYVPPYVPTVVEVLSDFLHVFETLEVQGEMRLSQSPTSPHLGTFVTGEEDWTQAFVFLPSLCPGGPSQFASDRNCGRVDLAVDTVIDVGYSDASPTVGVRVDPFTGEVVGTTLRLYGRDVEIGVKQLVNVTLDVVVAVASDGDYYDFEYFLVDIVPCDDLQDAIDDLACDVSDGDVCSIPGIEQACVAASVIAVQALHELLGQIENGLELDFDQRALIHDVPAGGRAEVLGSPSSPASNDESALEGGTETLLIMGGDLDSDSWWYGKRTR